MTNSLFGINWSACKNGVHPLRAADRSVMTIGWDVIMGKKGGAVQSKPCFFGEVPILG